MGSLLDEEEFIPFFTKMRYRHQNKLVRCNARLHPFFTTSLSATAKSTGYQLLWSAFGLSQPLIHTRSSPPLYLVDSRVLTEQTFGTKSYWLSCHLLTASAYIAIDTRARVSFCWDYPILWPFLYTLKSSDDAQSTFFRQFVFQKGVLRHHR